MRVLVVEDQEKMANLIKQELFETGYDVDIADNGIKGQELAKNQKYDLIIMDVMLPEQSGIDTSKNIRNMGFNGPILMLSALSTTKDKVVGLDAGADDYLTKPYSLEELQARVRALIRRSNTTTSQTHLSYHTIHMDLVERTVIREGTEIHLTAKEFILLEHFLKHPNQAISRSDLAENVWGTSFDSDSNIIDVYINMLRKKIDSGFSEKLLHTVVGVGYELSRKH